MAAVPTRETADYSAGSSIVADLSLSIPWPVAVEDIVIDTDKQISGRQILLLQQAEGRLFFIDCCLGMRPGLEAAFRDVAKDYQQIADALDAHDLDTPSQITPNQPSS